MAASENNNNDLKAQIALVLDKLASMDSKIDNIAKQNEERLEKLEGRVFKVEQDQTKLGETVNELERNQNLSAEMNAGLEYETKLNTQKGLENEQYQRNFNIRIFNMHEKDNETIEECEEKVLELFNQTLGVKVKLEDIDILHRLGPKKPYHKQDSNKNNKPDTDQKIIEPTDNSGESMEVQSGDDKTSGSQNNDIENRPSDDTAEANNANDDTYSRPIIVSFIARRIRRLVLTNRSKLKKKPGQKTKPIIITEDLTKYHHALLSKVRDSEKYDGGAWSKDGKIFAKHGERIIRIKGFGDIVNGPPVKNQRNQQNTSTLPRGGGNQRGRGGAPRRYPRGYPPRHQPHSRPGRWGIPSGSPMAPLRASPFWDRGLITLGNRYDPLQDTLDSYSQEDSIFK